ncbi:MAG: fumarate hydratase C-terminal domain-containing protein [Thaumarchaeota archaeon]|nr:fumarate hydratase C-terminal domain-containing protein [Nitrososphaerota archaeon]
MEYRFRTPIDERDVRRLRVGDIVFVDGVVVSCRDAGHRRCVEYLRRGEKLPVDLSGLVLYHMGPVVRKLGARWVILSAGPTTSARMEKYEAELIEKAGVRLIVGKGGMGAKTAEACREFGAAYAIFPGGAGALAAKLIERVERVEWLDLGVPEAMWVLRVRDFGPLMIAIDSAGRNFYEDHKKLLKENLRKAYSLIGYKA